MARRMARGVGEKRLQVEDRSEVEAGEDEAREVDWGEVTAKRWAEEEELAGQLAEGVEFDVRMCAIPTCPGLAVEGSMFCGHHQGKAVGQEGMRELQLLVRETERLAKISDEKEARRAAARFRARIRNGEFATLFSEKMLAMVAEAGRAQELNQEIAVARMGLSRALLEIDDPREMGLTIARLVEATARASREHRIWAERKASRKGGSVIDFMQSPEGKLAMRQLGFLKERPEEQRMEGKGVDSAGTPTPD